MDGFNPVTGRFEACGKCADAIALKRENLNLRGLLRLMATHAEMSAADVDAIARSTYGIELGLAAKRQGSVR